MSCLPCSPFQPPASHLDQLQVAHRVSMIRTRTRWSFLPLFFMNQNSKEEFLKFVRAIHFHCPARRNGLHSRDKHVAGRRFGPVASLTIIYSPRRRRSSTLGHFSLGFQLGPLCRFSILRGGRRGSENCGGVNFRSFLGGVFCVCSALHGWRLSYIESVHNTQAVALRPTASGEEKRRIQFVRRSVGNQNEKARRFQGSLGFAKGCHVWGGA